MDPTQRVMHTYNLVSEEVAAAAKALPVHTVAVLAAVGPPCPWTWKADTTRKTTQDTRHTTPYKTNYREERRENRFKTLPYCMSCHAYNEKQTKSKMDVNYPRRKRASRHDIRYVAGHDNCNADRKQRHRPVGGNLSILSIDRSHLTLQVVSRYTA